MSGMKLNMDEKNEIASETQVYLAKIGQTVQASRNLIESVRLRIAETDRMLEREGLTREGVRNFVFSDAQKNAVNEELERMGMARLDDEEEPVRLGACTAGANFSAGDGDGSVENRKRKFNVMMQQFRM